MYIYIYIYIEAAPCHHNGNAKGDTRVCDKNTPSERTTRANFGFGKTKSGAGEQFLLFDCRAGACAEGVLISQTLVAPESLNDRGTTSLNNS